MEKKNTGLIILVIILSLLVVGLGGFIVYDKVLFDDRIEDNKINNENVNGDNLSNDKIENNNQQNITNNSEKDNNSTDAIQGIDDGGTLVGSFQNYDLDNVKKDTKLTELRCDKKTTMYIENGNIIFSNGVNKHTIETNNAKYIYAYGYMECDTYYFFYITDNGELYTFRMWLTPFSSDITTTMDELQKDNNFHRVGVRDGDKFVGFLGTGGKFYANGAEVYIIGVLNDKNEEKYYAYFLNIFN